MRRLVIFCMLAGASTAHAEKKRTTAQALAGIGTGVSSALILSGFLFAQDGHPIHKPLMYSGLASAAITPSLGQIYAGQYVTLGMAVRASAAGLATYAIVHEQKTVVCDSATSSAQKCTAFYGAGIAMLGVAAIAFIGGMAYDVDDAAPAVDRYNKSHGIIIIPNVPTQQGPAPGLSVAGYF